MSSYYKDQNRIWEAFADRVSYSGVVLDDDSRNKLIISPEVSKRILPPMDVICHHMTINMGPLKDRTRLGKTEQLIATHIGTINDGIVAVKVKGNSSNSVPHITVAVNRQAGYKPKHSNDIKHWVPLSYPITLNGVVAEVR